MDNFFYLFIFLLLLLGTRQWHPRERRPLSHMGILFFFFFYTVFCCLFFVSTSILDFSKWWNERYEVVPLSFFFPSTFPSVDFESKMAELFLMQYRPMYSSVNYPKTLDDWAKCLSGLKAFRSHLIELRNKRKCYSLYLLKSRRYGWQLWGRFVCNPRARANPMKWWHSEQLNMAFTVRWR